MRGGPGLGAGSSLVPSDQSTGQVHDHIWGLIETEYDDGGRSYNRFECACGSVSYV